jgi:hypothetical protein
MCFRSYDCENDVAFNFMPPYWPQDKGQSIGHVALQSHKTFYVSVIQSRKSWLGSLSKGEIRREKNKIYGVTEKAKIVKSQKLKVSCSYDPCYSVCV